MTRESAPTVVERPSAIRAVLRSPLYRGGAIAVFLSALGTSAAAPQITLFLINDLHASLSTAGLYYLTSLTAPVAGYLIGARSDRTKKRLGLFRLCALAGFVGWFAMAFANQVWIPFVISAVVLAFSGAATSQLFAAIHDELKQTHDAANDGVISIVRMALTAGWIVGPVLGFYLAAEFGSRTMLIVTAFCMLAQIIPLGFSRGPRLPASESADEPSLESEHVVRTRGFRVMLPLLAFAGLYALVYAGEPIKYGYLSIYMRDDLHLPAVISGAVIGIQPLIELALMPIAVIVARRVGIMHLMIVGALFGVAANLCFALTSSAAGMFAGQIFMGAVWGIFAGLGIVVAQRLLPHAVATASAIFLSSTAVASALGGVAGSIGVGMVGLPLVFIVPAVFGLIASVGLAIMSRSRHAVA
ncbi:MAG TPA: MFS transporter [Galbitalea sp.]|jgi:SET family sugar efflux transporter-like MFS transporter